MFAHASAAIVAPSSTAALPVWVRRNRRSGVWRFRVHAVCSGAVTTGRDSVTSRLSPTAGLIISPGAAPASDGHRAGAAGRPAAPARPAASAAGPLVGKVHHPGAERLRPGDAG